MNVAFDYRNMPADAAADAYAEHLAYLDARDDAIQLCIEDRAAEIERTLREGEVYGDNSILSILDNADDASRMRALKCLSVMLETASRGIDSVAAALLVGLMEGVIKDQSIKIATEEIDV